MKLTDYIFGSRRGREANRIEREAQVDPFLADAIEGYDSVYGDHSDRLAALEQEVALRAARSRRRRGGRRVASWVWGSAAAVVLAAGTAWYLLRPAAPVVTEGIAQALPAAEGVAVRLAEAPAATVAALQAEADREAVVSQAASEVSPVLLAAEPLRVEATGGREGVPDAPSDLPKDANGRAKEASESDVCVAALQANAVGDGVAMQDEAEVAAVDEMLRVVRSAPRVAVGVQVEMVSNEAFTAYFERSRRVATLPDGKRAQGCVVAEFRVNDAGVPSEIRVVEGISSEINREVIDLLQRGPHWEPTGERRVRTVLIY